MRFAESVTNIPLTAAQFDDEVLSVIRTEFFSLKLPRVKLVNAMGHILVPENVLVDALTFNTTEQVYCMVPVGVIGKRCICKDHNGNLYDTDLPSASEFSPLDEYYFDITEVVK